MYTPTRTETERGTTSLGTANDRTVMVTRLHLKLGNRPPSSLDGTMDSSGLSHRREITTDPRSMRGPTKLMLFAYWGLPNSHGRHQLFIRYQYHRNRWMNRLWLLSFSLVQAVDEWR